MDDLDTSLIAAAKSFSVDLLQERGIPFIASNKIRTGFSSRTKTVRGRIRLSAWPLLTDVEGLTGAHCSDMLVKGLDPF